MNRETYAKYRNQNLQEYWKYLKNDVFPFFDGLQSAGKISWYALLLMSAKVMETFPPSEKDFLLLSRFSIIHDAEILKGWAPNGATGVYLHVYMGSISEQCINIIDEALISAGFAKTKEADLGEIYPLKKSYLKSEEWVEAWKIIKNATDYTRCILNGSAVEKNIPNSQMIQFFHYVTNPLGLGMLSSWAVPRLM